MRVLKIALAAVLLGMLGLLPQPAFAQSETRVTGGAGGVFPGGTTLNDVSLDGLRFGMGVIITSTGSAIGQFQATLLALGPQNIEINGKATEGSVGLGGTATFRGACSLDMGDGGLPLQSVPFTVTVTTNAEGQGTLGLVIGSTSLPTATVNEGSMTIQ